MRGTLIESAEVAPDHQADQIGLAGLRGETFADGLPVPQHQDAGGDAQDFLHAVRNVDHRNTGRREPLDQREECFRLVVGQRRSRLVERDDAHGSRKRPQNLDELALRWRKAVAKLVGIDHAREAVALDIRRHLGA